MSAIIVRGFFFPPPNADCISRYEESGDYVIVRLSDSPLCDEKPSTPSPATHLAMTALQNTASPVACDEKPST